MRAGIIRTTIKEAATLEGMELMFHFQGKADLDIPLDFTAPLKATLSVSGRETPIAVNENFELGELLLKQGGSTSFSLKFYSPCRMANDFKLPEGVSIWVTPLENNPYDTPIRTLSN